MSAFVEEAECEVGRERSPPMPVTAHASTARQVEFCGRDGELEVIRQALGYLAEGTSAVVVIEGGAGMGKSRLLSEVIGVARNLGVQVGASAADPSESMVDRHRRRGRRRSRPFRSHLGADHGGAGGWLGDRQTRQHRSGHRRGGACGTGDGG
jgi:hypothetical protein